MPNDETRELTSMKYTVDIVIDKPVDEVITLFDDPDGLMQWMEGLEKFEHLEGTPSEVGAKSRLHFKMGKREIEMIETITVKNLPEEFGGTYEADGVFNTNMVRFKPVGSNQTRMSMDTEFEFQNLMMKLMGFFMPGAFKKQTKKNLEAFKAYAEGK